MSFELDRSQKQIQDAAWEFARGEFDKDLLLDLARENEFPEEIWKKAGELGFLGLHVDEVWGGGSMGLFETALVAETFCRKDSTCGMALMLSGFSSELILRFGNDEQKRRWLPGIAEGTQRCGGAFLEEGNGYNLTKLECSAFKDGDTWTIHGEKTQVVNAESADFFLVLARTAAGAPPEKAFSLFLVEKAPSLAITPLQKGLGGTMTTMGKVAFKDVTVADDRRIGKEGAGLAMVQSFLDESAILQAAMAIGMAHGAMERSISYADKRKQFGREISLFETVQHKIAQMATKIEAARFITYQAAATFGSKAQKKKAPSLPTMSAQTALRTAEEVTDEAIQIHGGYGYMQEGEIEHFYRDAKFLTIFTSNPGQRNSQIARNMIKGGKS